jgi:surface polysaccharide O-acyltransferase-like enzyme
MTAANQLDNKSTDWLDAVRWIATIAVITIHVVAPYLYQYGQISNLNWNIYNIIDSLSRFAVPFFVMLSGALLLNRSITLTDFLKKRFIRILIPFLFWSIAYSIYHYFKADEYQNTNYLIYFISSLVDGASYHLWYIYMLIGLYLAIPILNKWIVNANNNLVHYFILIWFFGLTISFFDIRLSKDFSLTIFTGYLGYLILGYYIAHRSSKINTYLLLAIFIASVAFTFFATLIHPLVNGVFNGKYYQYLSINVVMASASLFMLVKNSFNLNKYYLDKIKYCNKYGFGVYLVHVFVLDALQLLTINGGFINPIIGTVVTIIVCYLISLLLIALLSRIRVLADFIN